MVHVLRAWDEWVNRKLNANSNNLGTILSELRCKRSHICMAMTSGGLSSDSTSLDVFSHCIFIFFSWLKQQRSCTTGLIAWTLPVFRGKNISLIIWNNRIILWNCYSLQYFTWFVQLLTFGSSKVFNNIVWIDTGMLSQEKHESLLNIYANVNLE